jgi:hypothetical protein
MDNRCIIWQNGPATRDTNPMVHAMAEGIDAIDGWRTVRRNGQYFNASTAETNVELALFVGFRSRARALVAGHRENGIHVTLVELGYLRRSTTYRDEAAYYQASIDQLCWLPPVDCPTDRFDALGLKLKARRTKKGEDILILGHVPSDGQHGLAEQALAAWYAQAVTMLRVHTHRRIIFRPHPRVADLDLCPSADEQQDPTTPLADAFKAARACVTYNSTAGTEAHLGAIPVICADAVLVPNRLFPGTAVPFSPILPHVRKGRIPASCGGDTPVGLAGMAQRNYAAMRRLPSPELRDEARLARLPAHWRRRLICSAMVMLNGTVPSMARTMAPVSSSLSSSKQS